MRVEVYPSIISGKVSVPASKSCMQRACALALIHRGITHISNPGISHDDQSALTIIKNLGADIIKEEADGLMIQSGGVAPRKDRIYCGESGLAIRMFTPISAIANTSITIEGGGSLRNRPMGFFGKTLSRLQVDVISNDGKLPVCVKGPLRPQSIEVSGALSSQYITGLLLAYAALRVNGVALRVQSPTSVPYIALTLTMMSHFGYDIMHDSTYTFFKFHKKTYNRLSNNVSYMVESDWSSAAILIVAAAIRGDCTFDGLKKESAQADKVILDVLQKAGVFYTWEGNSLCVRKSIVKPFHFDATHCPDLFPPLVALAASAKGQSTILGTHRLTHKESNRSVTLSTEFHKLGIHIDIQEDMMIIDGTGEVSGGSVFSHNDHRIAMSCAVAALVASNKVTIQQAEVVRKSYPRFYDDLVNIGASVHIC